MYEVKNSLAGIKAPRSCEADLDSNGQNLTRMITGKVIVWQRWIKGWVCRWCQPSVGAAEYS